MLHPQQAKAGFTRLEFVAVIAGLGLLALVAIPALATSLNDSHRAVCANNLRQLGSAIVTWAGDHGGAVPWRVPSQQGGTFYTPKAGNAWFEFVTLSNHVAPRVTTCPADAFGDPSIGASYDWPTFWTNRQNSVSYQLNLEVGMRWQDEAALVFADRNTRYDFDGTSCSAGVANPKGVLTASQDSVFQWTNAVHGLSGHALTMDGTVKFITTGRLRSLVDQEADAGACHFLKAR